MEQLRKHIEEISPLTDEEFEYVKGFFTMRNVRKHQYLLQDGDEARHEYWIAKGIFRVFYIDKEGKEHIVQFAQQNWWMSDYGAYFKQSKTRMHIECMESGEVFATTLQAREKLAAHHHKMEHFFRMKLTNGYVSQQRRIMSLLSSSPQERYEEFADLYPNIMQKIPKKYIAEYLGVSRETLSRLYSDNKA